MNRREKAQEVQSIGELMGSTNHAFLLDFAGLDVAQATELRRKLREQEACMRVVKNRLAVRALEGTPLGQLNEAFVGQTAIAYLTGTDVVGVAKLIRDFAEEHEVLRVKAGVVDGQVITTEEFETLADLPPREALLAKALYLMIYPVAGLVTALRGVIRSSVVVLDQIRLKKESEGET